MTESLDIDKIEEELKLIKSEDWRLGLTGENIWDTSDCIIHESLDKDLSMEQKIINAKFFFKSKERIASLVKRVRNFEVALKRIRDGNLNDFSDPSVSMSDYADKILRGSNDYPMQ